MPFVWRLEVAVQDATAAVEQGSIADFKKVWSVVWRAKGGNGSGSVGMEEKIE